LVLQARPDRAKEIEILVLRHQLVVLQRRTPRPRLRWTDRAVIAALVRLLPLHRRLGLLVTPSTIMHWHPRCLPTSRAGATSATSGSTSMTAQIARASNTLTSAAVGVSGRRMARRT
jgi:hypothetical protein